MTNYLIKQEPTDLTGASLSGTSGTANRTYELTYANSINAGMVLVVAGAILQEGTHFSKSGSTITFLTEVWDDQAISISYYVADTSADTGSNYTNTLKVAQITGIASEVFDEVVGTGDGSSVSYDLDNGNVINGSYSLSYGASGSNNLTELTETTDYVISIDEGRILLTASGATKLSTNILYASYMYSPKMSDTLISSYITAAEKEVEKRTGNYWGPAVSATEYFDGRLRFGYPTTDQPFTPDWDEPDSVVLKFKGITDVDSAYFLTRGSATISTATTIYSYQMAWEDWGKVTFLNHRIPNGTKNVQVNYSHGYATVPSYISELTALVTGLRVFCFITGGSYDDMTGYTIGRKSVQIGEAYVNVRSVIDIFNNRIEVLLDSFGRKMDVM